MTKYFYVLILYNMALEHPFRALVVAPSASGKTYLLINTLLKKHFKKKFNYIWSVIPTLFQKQWQEVDLPKDRTFDEATDEKFEEVLEKIKDIHNKQPNKKHLIILDDVAYTPLLKFNSALGREILRLRHFNASIIILSQLYKAVPPAIRVNLSDMILFRNDNNGELKKIEEEISSVMDHYDEATREPYSYLHIDFTENLMSGKRFNKSPFSKKIK